MDEILRNAEAIDAIEAESITVGGQQAMVIRGRFWGTFSAIGCRDLVADQAKQVIQQREHHDDEDQDQDDRSPRFVEIIGTASSTGIDWHGTEMSREALESMALQFQRGVFYAPTHDDREWHQRIGETVAAQVVPVASIASAADPSEPQFLLTTTTRIDTRSPLGHQLVSELSAGAQIGQSIGGWFTRMAIVQGGDGEPDRMIVLEVELDHLAVTRTPSNRESLGLGLRERVMRQVQQFRAQAGEADSHTPTQEPEMGETPADPTDVPEPVMHARSIQEQAECTANDCKTCSDSPREPTEQTDEPEAPQATEQPSQEAQGSETLSEDTVVSEETEPSEEALAAAAEEIDMTKDELSEVLRSTLGTLNERLDRLEAAPVSQPEAVQLQVGPSAEDELRARIAELEAEKNELQARREADAKLVERVTRRPARQTRAYQAGTMHIAAEIAEGDFSGLIERARAENPASSLVAVSARKSGPLHKLMQLDDSNAQDLGYQKPEHIARDLRSAFQLICRGAFDDGLLDHLDPSQVSGGWTK